MEVYKFTEITSHPEHFFKLLPQDWQDEIVPFWEDQAAHAVIYGIDYHETLVGGGIVFYASPPNFDYFEDEAQSWFSQGYHYLGFIYIDPNYRNKNLGSFWLTELKLRNPHQDYFLLTEEDHLQHFYEKNGFVRVKAILNDRNLEWLYQYVWHNNK